MMEKVLTRTLISLEFFIYYVANVGEEVMAIQSNDTIYFLILWLVAMFVTLAGGILIIMYQVKCFPCQKNEVGAEVLVQKQTDFHLTQLDPRNAKTCAVCGEVMSTEEEGEIHQSCHDVDVMCV